MKVYCIQFTIFIAPAHSLQSWTQHSISFKDCHNILMENQSARFPDLGFTFVPLRHTRFFNFINCFFVQEKILVYSPIMTVSVVYVFYIHELALRLSLLFGLEGTWFFLFFTSFIPSILELAHILGVYISYAWNLMIQLFHGIVNLSVHLRRFFALSSWITTCL